MARRTISLDVKFPALMTGIALVFSAVFVFLGQRELTRVLEESAGARLSANGIVIANLLGQSLAAGAGALQQISRASDPRARVAALPVDSSRVGLRFVDSSGAVTDYVGSVPADAGAAWVRDAARRGALDRVSPTFSPIRSVDGSAAFDIVVPVPSSVDSATVRGWLVDTRLVQGRGVGAVRQLAEAATILVGTPDEGAWTDLERIVPGPPPGVRAGEDIVFDDSPRGPGVGHATIIIGTPWVVWLQRDRDVVLAPIDAFYLRLAPIVLVLAILVFFVVWRTSHRFTHRVVELTARVDRMSADAAKPGTTPTPPEEGEDEIERLESSFDKMFERTHRQFELEEQLQQAQRLEAVGRLAGGVAHDFNNVLTVITNYGELLRADAAEGSQTANDLDQVLRAAGRASRLTRQLLAFSRRQILQPERLDLNTVVQESHEMLRRLIPTSITLELDLSEALTPIVADPVQVEQVLVNLAVNAADAMPSGGTLTFRTTMGELDPEDSEPSQLERRYVCLVVRDEGSGMDRATVARIFEPFFTTKPQGKGTGLGLATVHGIVTQLGGRIWVHSEVGKGTTFKVYLPIADELPPPKRRSTPRTAMRAVTAGRVLLVEDDDATRAVAVRILEEQGFTVRTAHDGAAALLALHTGAPPDVVVTDMMMPGVDGAELAHHIRASWPTLPIVLISGYSDVELASANHEAHVTLEKPFTARALTDAIGRALQLREVRG